MITLTLSAAATLLGAQHNGADGTFTGVSTDTRTLVPRQLFFALRGPHHDGHDLVAAAFARGAAGAVVERAVAAPGPCCVVPDTRRALGQLARAWRLRFELPLLAVTGSAGKTTVKNMLASIMGIDHVCLATEGNLNNDIGVPLTLFGLGPEHTAAVIEMGANRAGDIAYLCAVACPRVGVITLCAPAHLEGFGSLEGVARTKGEIVAALAPDGVAVINAADPFAPLWRTLAGRRQVVDFGAGGAVTAAAVRTGARGSTFDLCLAGARRAVEIAYPGEHNVRNALAAAAAAHAAGVGVDQIADGLARARPARGRLQRREGARGLCVLDDSYNANPASVGAALDVLAAQPGEHWFLFGDMGELGEQAAAYHAEIGRTARRAGVTRLYTVGPLAAHAAQAFGQDAAAFMPGDDVTAALQRALAATAAPVTLLVKGSRMMQLERVTDALVAGEATPC